MSKKNLCICRNSGEFRNLCKSIFKVGLAPFGLALTPNISLVIINWFSAFYGGEKAIATCAGISYIICIIYLALQGVGDGSQPLMSKYYGERKANELAEVKRMAYIFPVNLAFIGCAIMYFGRWHVGTLFSSSDTVNSEIAKIIPFFLVSVSFFSNYKNFYCWILCNRKSSIVLCFDIYWTCPHAWINANFATAIWRTDYDLVEHCICKNYFSYVSVIA